MNYLEKYGVTSRFKDQATLYPQLLLARVMAQHRGLYKIVTETGEYQAEISGKFRYETSEMAKFPTVGDFVMISQPNYESNVVIHEILPRKSVFLRTAVGVSGQAQSVASNIDTVFICMSLNNNFNLSRLERYLSVAWDSGATPVILLTKSDLAVNISETLKAVEKVSGFCDVIPLSMMEDDVAHKLEKYLTAEKTSAFIGSSGVGKSTLINRLIGKDVLLTSEVGRADKGRHTTTGREMFSSPLGGVLIDTPGMRELGVESVDLAKTFDDIEQLATQCRFNNCTHTNEPDCEILKALDNGEIDQRRLDSYFKLKNEAGYEGLGAKEIEVKKLERMFKDVGGMKNMRKFAKEQKKRK